MGAAVCVGSTEGPQPSREHRRRGRELWRGEEGIVGLEPQRKVLISLEAPMCFRF